MYIYIYIYIYMCVCVCVCVCVYVYYELLVKPLVLSLQCHQNAVTISDRVIAYKL